MGSCLNGCWLAEAANPKKYNIFVRPYVNVLSWAGLTGAYDYELSSTNADTQIFILESLVVIKVMICNYCGVTDPHCFQKICKNDLGSIEIVRLSKLLDQKDQCFVVIDELKHSFTFLERGEAFTCYLRCLIKKMF